jgi:hypothetical protein
MMMDKVKLTKIPPEVIKGRYKKAPKVARGTVEGK